MGSHSTRRSSKGNELLTKIKKFEVREEGVVIQARRPIKFDEFLNVLTLSSDTVFGSKQFDSSCI